MPAELPGQKHRPESVSPSFSGTEITGPCRNALYSSTSTARLRTRWAPPSHPPSLALSLALPPSALPAACSSLSLRCSGRDTEAQTDSTQEWPTAPKASAVEGGVGPTSYWDQLRTQRHEGSPAQTPAPQKPQRSLSGVEVQIPQESLNGSCPRG